MPIPSGTRLGPYEVIAQIGVGGMGEVFRAVDARLGREVAIKVLRPDALGNPERIQRFEREARLVGGLNHPNVLAVFDVGSYESTPYLVTELLEGLTLRQQLLAGALPVRRALEYALQIAQGLAAAHEKGVVHRDLKPENIFVTEDGRLKVLDFGLAKVHGLPGSRRDESDFEEGSADTVPGVMLGTVGYMAPEQVRGELADARADLFAFGALFYEMLAGERAFQGETSVDVLQAILRGGPQLLPPRIEPWPTGLQDLVLRCLEKRREQRFQSARDLSFQLEFLLRGLGSNTPAPRAAQPELGQKGRLRGRALVIGAGVVAALGLVAGGIAIGRALPAPVVPPVYTRLTFARGTVTGARFAADGQTLVYSAAWEGNPSQLYSLRLGGTEARPLGLAPAQMLAFSRSDELAFLQEPRDFTGFTSIGTLAKVSFSGGAPRALATDVLEADWSPAGALAVIRQEGGVARLEMPVGTLLYQTNGALTHLRVSPDGERIAFVDHPVMGDDAGQVAVVDLHGQKTVLTSNWFSAQGLAWKGNEIWFTADPGGSGRGIWAVSLSGAVRAVARVPGVLTLQDISPSGRVLFTREIVRNTVAVHAPGAPLEQDLSWLDFSTPSGISRDGKLLSLMESGEGAGSNYGSYLRPTDGAPAIKLGEGAYGGISPDGKWVVTAQAQPANSLSLLPTGPGVARTLVLPLEQIQRVWWARDGQLLIAGNRKGEEVRHFLCDVATGEPRPITPPGIVNRRSSRPLAPDGRLLFAMSPGGGYALYRVGEDGPSRPVPGLEPEEEPLEWTPDGRALLVARRTGFPVKVSRVDITTGARSLWRELSPPDRAGAQSIHYLAVASGADAYVYSFVRHLSDLYVADGLR